MNTLIALSLCLLAMPETPPMPRPLEVAYSENEELQSYIEEGAAEHPQLEALYYQWLAALERIPQARALDDPMLGFGQMLSARNVPTMIEIEQRIPWFGMRRAAADVAASEAETTLQDFIAARNELIAEIKLAYFDYALLGDEIEIVRVQQMILDYVQEIIEMRLGLGLSREDELLRISAERLLMEDRLARLESEKPMALARLNLAIGVSADTDRPIPRGTVFPQGPPPFDVLMHQIEANNPRLEGLSLLAQVRVREQEMARANSRPMVTLGLEYSRVKEYKRGPRMSETSNRFREQYGQSVRERFGRDDGTGIFPVGPEGLRESMTMENSRSLELRAGFSIPIYRNKTRAAIREAKYLEQSAKLEREALRLALEAEAQILLAELEDAKRRHRLFGESMVPLALDTYESLQNNFSAGLADSSFLDLLGAIQQVLDFQIEQARAAALWQKAHTELEVLVGGAWRDDSPPLEEDRTAQTTSEFPELTVIEAPDPID